MCFCRFVYQKSQVLPPPNLLSVPHPENRSPRRRIETTAGWWCFEGFQRRALARFRQQMEVYDNPSCGWTGRQPDFQILNIFFCLMQNEHELDLGNLLTTKPNKIQRSNYSKHYELCNYHNEDVLNMATTQPLKSTIQAARGFVFSPVNHGWGWWKKFGRPCDLVTLKKKVWTAHFPY